MAEMQASPEGCPKCGTSYKEEKVNRSAQKSISDKTAQKIAVLALLLLVAFGAGAGWIKYQEYRAALSMVEAQVRLTTAYVEQMISATTESSSITFRELFANADRYVAEIDSALVKVSIIEPAISEIGPAQRYMRAGQEMIRNISGQARVFMELSSAKDREKRANDQAASSNSYIREMSGEAMLKAVDDQIKALDALKEKKAALSQSAKDILAAKDELDNFDDSVFLRPEITDKLVSN